MSEELEAHSHSFFEDELDAFKFRNEMRKRPDYVVKYPDIAGLTSEEFYARIRRDNEALASTPLPVVEEPLEVADDRKQAVSRAGKIRGLFSSRDSS